MTEKDDHKRSVLQVVGGHQKKRPRYRLVYSGGQLVYARSRRPTRLLLSKQAKENPF